MYSNALRIYLWMTYTVPYHAPLRPVHLSFVYVTAHEKVPETKKGDDGVLLLRRGAPDEIYGALYFNNKQNAEKVPETKKEARRRTTSTSRAS